jgi:hypothetical protein
MEISPNGRLAVGLDDGSLVVWDLNGGTNRTPLALNAHEEAVSKFAFGADNRVVSGGLDAASRCSSASSRRACCLACHRFRKRDGQAVRVNTHRQPDTFVRLLSRRHHEACAALAQFFIGAIDVRH